MIRLVFILTLTSIISLAETNSTKIETDKMTLPIPSCLPAKCQKKWTMALTT